MRIQLESTTKIVTLNGIPARIWEGATQSGIRVHAYITRIAAPEDADLAQFELELSDCRPPGPDVAAIPARLIL
jgi:hypothetical protein